MNKIAFLLFVVITSTGTTLAQSKEDTIQWLTESSFDLQTTNPEVKIEDIPFEKILGDAQMVLAGEATHGTREFAEMKHRLFRYLVEELGFRYFFIEADFAAGIAVDRYIRGEGSDPVEVLKGLRYFHIVNKEGLALIRWMKAFNETKSASDRIRFFGIDCQTSENAFTQLKEYFLQVDSVFYREISGIKLKDHRVDRPMSTLDRKYPLLTLSSDTRELLRNRLTTNKTKYTDASSQIHYKIALRLAEVLSQSFEIGQRDEGHGYSKREQSMAANVEWALNEIDPEPEKSFLWAHNAHVMYSDITEGRNGKVVGTSLGKILKNSLHEKVYSIAMDFNRGSFIANEVKPDTIVKKVWTVNEAPENTFPYLLSKTHREVLFMDFNSSPNKNVVNWLKDNKVRGRSIGGAYHPDFPSRYFRSYVLPESCDGLIFINDTREITLELH